MSCFHKTPHEGGIRSENLQITGAVIHHCLNLLPCRERNRHHIQVTPYPHSVRGRQMGKCSVLQYVGGRGGVTRGKGGKRGKRGGMGGGGGGYCLFEGKHPLPNYHPRIFPALDRILPPPIFEGHRPPTPKIKHSQN